MAQPRRTFRVFVSSSFADLKSERDALQRDVFPRLKELSERRGARFQAIDLRWGVSQEAGLDQRTIPICLAEIERYQTQPPQLNFIVLLGDRYGWRPLPHRIPAVEFREILSRLSAEQEDRLTEWYLEDENAVPTEYYLKPRAPDGEFAAYEAWAPIERELHSYLLAGMEGKPNARYTTSATELEVEVGLRPPDAAEHFFAFFRELKTDDGSPFAGHLPSGRDAKDFIDLLPEPSEDLDADAHERLLDLKQRLRARLPGNVHEYVALWAEGRISTGHIGELPDTLDECLALLDAPEAPHTLCVDVWRELATIMTRQLDELGAAASEEEFHRSFAEERARVFVGREGILADIAAYLAGDAANLCVVVGSPGSGKSSLLAKAAEQARAAHPGAVVLDRYIGTSAGSANIRTLLADVCRTVSVAYGGETPIATEYQELALELPKRLALATIDRPLVLFLDALDQLSESQWARNLVWLPASLPEHAHVVVSTREEMLDRLEAKRPTPAVLRLDQLSREEGSELLDRWLNGAGRRLTDVQHDHVLDAFDRAGGMPLYLKLAFEVARQWTSTMASEPLGDDIEGIIRDNVFERLGKEEHHGRLLVERSLAYLAASRHGLAEDELLALLSRDEDLFRQVKAEAERTGHTLPEAGIDRRLPVVLWSRLSVDLDAYLAERLTDSIALLGFYHRELEDVATKSYLREDVLPVRHAALADYFRSQVDPAGDGSWTGSDLRGLSELPYHLAEAGRLDELYETLTDFRFLERKAAEVGVVRYTDAGGETTATFTGVFRLQDDLDLALAKFGGGDSTATRPLIVTAVNFGDGMVVRCPWCNTAHTFDRECPVCKQAHDLEDWKGKEVACTNPKCKGPLKVNELTVGSARHEG